MRGAAVLLTRRERKMIGSPVTILRLRDSFSALTDLRMEVGMCQWRLMVASSVGLILHYGWCWLSHNLSILAIDIIQIM